MSMHPDWRLFWRIVGYGGPAGFAVGALVGIFLHVPGDPPPAAGRALIPPASTVAPPETQTAPALARLRTDDTPTRRASTRQATRITRAAQPTRAARTTVTVTPTPTTTPSAAPESDEPDPEAEGTADTRPGTPETPR